MLDNGWATNQNWGSKMLINDDLHCTQYTLIFTLSEHNAFLICWYTFSNAKEWLHQSARVVHELL